MGRFAVTALAAALALAAGASATPVSASVSLTGFVSVAGVSNTVTNGASWGVPLSPLSTSMSVQANATGASGLVTVFAQGNISATWGTHGNSGSVDFTNYGWGSTPFGSSEQADLNGGARDWSYTFIADASGVFTMHYNVTASGAPFGLQGWNIGWSGPGGGLTLLSVYNPTASGTFTRAVVAGDSYTVFLKNNANISSGATLSGASMNGTFDFTSPIPEPLTLSLFGAGLITAAAARRRRCKTA